MTKVTVKTLNNTYVLEQDDAGKHKVVETTNDEFRSTFVGFDCTGPVVGQVVFIHNGRGGHTSNVTEITYGE